MGSRSATELLQLPVQLNGIRLGRPIDLLFDTSEWRVLGFVVLCGDESRRFLVFAAADLRESAIEVRSAFLLLEHLDFYSDRSRSLRELLGGDVVNGRQELGELRDLVLASDGSVESLLVVQDDDVREIRPVGLTVESGHVSSARG
jgi:hypothetical protein